MTGGEHYREAERLLAFARDGEFGADLTPDQIRNFLTAAHVHATLAHAAAMVNDAWGRKQVLEPPRGDSLGQL